MIQQYEPPDATFEEKEILTLAVVDFYNSLPSLEHKLILAMHFELGYDYKDVADIIGVSYVTVWKKVKQMRKILGVRYSSNLRDVEVGAEKKLG